MANQTGANNPNWKGGRVIDPRGYVLIRVGKDHHLADIRGYAYEHRIEAEKKLGRRLRGREEIHHEASKSDNQPDKIVVTKSRLHHFAFHHRKRTDLRMPDQRNRMVNCACGCGERFRRFDDSNRPRKFVSGHNMRKL